MRRSAIDKVSSRFVMLLVAALGFLSLDVHAGSYFTRTWQVEQGVPQNKVTAIVQTQEGYLWIGTYNGLARFDGVRFTVFDENSTPELGSSRITSLFEAKDGALWIGTENGKVSRYENGRFAAVTMRLNWSGGKIYAITADGAGDVWLLNEAGELARVRDGTVVSPESGYVPKVLSLSRGTDGTVWIDREGVVSSLRDGHLTVEVSTNIYVQGICAASDGGIWVASSSRIRKWKDGKWTDFPGSVPWGWGIVTKLLETSSGLLAAGTSDSGLWLISPGNTNIAPVHLDRLSGLPSNWVLSLREDREKNLWCGTGTGLVLVRPSNLENISPPDQWKNCPVLSLLPAEDGTLWIGTEGAGLYSLRDGIWTNIYTSQGLNNPYVWSLGLDKAGKLWLGTWGGGIYAQTDSHSFAYAPRLETFRLPAPAMLFVEDELWIGTTAGALRYRHAEVEKFSEIAGEPFGDVRVIARDKSGSLWFGTAGNGLLRLQNGTFHRWKKADGLSSDFIDCLHFSEDETLWIGTFGGGLNRFKDGKFSVINAEHGLPNSVIGHIESDGDGFLWMSSYAGILRASEKDMNRCADGEITEVSFLSYGINDGLPTLECAEGLQSAGCKTADGRLWFPTAKGLVVVDPSGAIQNLLPPPVRIEEIRVDDKKFAHSAAAPIKIPPGRHRIEFEYTGLSFVAPEKVRFKCRLKNFDPEWSDVGAKRVATYSYIPPGAYSFQVTACNNDGVWSDTGASLAFEVLPYFWQTTWFRVLSGLTIVLLASGAVWFDTRRRLHRRLERAERQRDIERERARIARDIHDDLGAQLTRITMMSESARSEVGNTERAAARLEKIYDTARELTRSMDEIVWAVNPRHDTLEGLATYLEKFAQDWLATIGIRCRLDLPLQFPEWHLTSELRHNVFLAFKEALHNSVKHSGASEITITMTIEEHSFELILEDNGNGFIAGEAAKNRAGTDGRVISGNGLDNMGRRLATIGGTFEIQGRPGEGTKVVFRVPFEG